MSFETLIVGRGEVGNAHYELLKEVYPCWIEDIRPELQKMSGCPTEIDVLHICIRHSDEFTSIVEEYKALYKPNHINICTTVPIGTTETISPQAVHSTTRGLHPHLKSGLLNIDKHIGGGDAEYFKGYFEKAGIHCQTHALSKTTETLHLLNNVHYGLNILFADEASKICREVGVDYYSYMKYCESNNEGYTRLGHKTKVRTICTPPNGKIGGHCVSMSADMLSKHFDSKMLDLFKV